MCKINIKPYSLTSIKMLEVISDMKALNKIMITGYGEQHIFKYTNNYMKEHK